MSSPTGEDIAALMPQLKDELARLVEIASLSEWGFSGHTRPPLLECHQAVVELFRGAGVESFASLELPGTAPILTGEIPRAGRRPNRSALRPLRVVPAGDESEWESPPFEATERDGAIFGRGAADSKSNILVHVGALRAWGGRPPVGIKLLVEGQEEVGSPLEDGYPSANPEPFRADAISSRTAARSARGSPR